MQDLQQHTYSVLQILVINLDNISYNLIEELI
jgi:hypothetical protein